MTTLARCSRWRAFTGALFAFLLLAASAPAFAQSTASGGEGMVIDFSRPGQPSMTVYLWGGVGRAGLWRVERNVDLVQLLSAAQVPSIGTDRSGIRRRTSVNVYRLVNDKRRQIYSVRVDDLLKDGASYPQLQPEDVVEVKVRERRSVGIALIGTIISTASTVTLLALRLASGS